MVQLTCTCTPNIPSGGTFIESQTLHEMLRFGFCSG
jgi:hypothetical protein